MPSVNPYASPALPTNHESQPPQPVHFTVGAVQRTWLTRELELVDGATMLSLRYEAFGCGERVYVNGELAASTSIWNFRGRMINSVSDEIDFPLPWLNSCLAARVEVYAPLTMLGRITNFSLYVSERLVYSEP